MMENEIALGMAISELGSKSFATYFSAYMRQIVPYDSLAVFAYSDGLQPAVLSTHSDDINFVPDIENLYLPGMFRLDPFFALHTERADAGLYRLANIAPDRFKRERYFLEFYEGTKSIDEIAFISWPSEHVSIHTCLVRDNTTNKKFSPKEMTTANRNAPIIVSMMNKHWSNFLNDAPLSKTTLGLAMAAKSTLGIQLSPRQEEVATLILQGYSTFAISKIMGISAHTVKVFRKQIFKKCHISSQGELFKLLLPLIIS